VIRVVIFDFAGVVASDEADLWTYTYSAVVKKTDLSKNELSRMLSKHWPNMRLGKYSLDILWKEIKEKSKKPISIQELRKGLYDSLTIDQRVVNLIKGLKRKRIRVILLSNETKQGITNKIKKFHLRELFDQIYCSAYLGMAKPDPSLFFNVLKRNKLQPNEVVFIDDQRHIVEGAKKLGIPSILYKKFHQFKKQLYHYII